MADKEQIGLTPAGSTIMDRVLDTGYFTGKDDVAKLAIALAMHPDANVDGVKGAETTWHTKGLDSTGEFLTAIELLYPHVTEPYRAIEGLIDSGLRMINEHMDTRGELVVSELVAATAGTRTAPDR
jgi:hypothetical protein